jgi:H+-translocating NAD(P) transhydrogenase subunit alpha
MTDEIQTIAVLAEAMPGERRVALIPDDIRRFAGKLRFVVESGAGAKAGFPDEAYSEAGAEVSGSIATLRDADLVAAVRPPGRFDVLRPGAVLASLGAANDIFADTTRSLGITHLAFERLPRIARAQSMDVLSSQAFIAGYAAVVEAAQMLDTLLPMSTTAAGGIRPANMIALGAGVAGLQAIATARRLGAVVHGFDVREATREQVESLGGRFISAGPQLAMDGSGGYASAQSEPQQEALRTMLTPVLSRMQIIVTTAQIPGRPAPLLIDDATLAAMSSGTVIVDLAAETGGNTSMTKSDVVVDTGKVRIFGPTNLPSTKARDASRLFSGNVRALLGHILDRGGRLRTGGDDEIINALSGIPAEAVAA